MGLNARVEFGPGRINNTYFPHPASSPGLMPGSILTRSPGSLLSIQRAMMVSQVALTGGRVAMKPSGRAWPLEVGGGSCMVDGRLGIQTQKSN